MRINKCLIIDCQVLQTSSMNRGMGRYSLQLISSLIESGIGDKFDKVVFLLNSQLPSEYALSVLNKFELINVQIDYLNHHYILSSIENNEAVKLLTTSFIKANYKNYSVYYFILSGFELGQSVSVFPDSAIKVLLFYDLIPHLFSKEYLEIFQLESDYYYRFINIFKSDLIFSISETTRQDLITYLNVNPERIINIMGGPIDTNSASVKPDLDLNSGYILFTTGDNWRKNNERTIKAFKNFNKSTKNKFKLVVTSHFQSETAIKLTGSDDSVIFSGHISDPNLEWLYKNALGVVFTSIYEGLGLPILEAVQYMKPVLASDTGAFKEFSNEAFIWCDPLSTESITSGFHSLIGHKVNESAYLNIKERFNWTDTGKTSIVALEKLMSQNTTDRPALKSKKPKVALVGPSSNGFSAIGKFCQELMPIMSDYADVTYFAEIPTNNQSLKPFLTPYIWPSRSISELADTVHKYDQVIYNIGNSDYHLLTFLLALKYPDTVILHDIDLSGLTSNLVEFFPIFEQRISIEAELENQTKKISPAKFITSLINKQKMIVCHNEYSFSKIKSLHRNNSNIIKCQLPIAQPIFQSHTNSKPVVAISGHISLEKGLSNILDIVRKYHTKYTFIYFGYSKFDEAYNQVNSLHSEGKLELFTNLTDYEFNQLMRKADFLINLRLNYRGEASRTVLEALRYGVIPIVSNIGWFSELPNSIALKLKNNEDLHSLFENGLILNSKWKTNFTKSVNDYLKMASYDTYAKIILGLI